MKFPTEEHLAETINKTIQDSSIHPSLLGDSSHIEGNKVIITFQERNNIHAKYEVTVKKVT